MFIVISAITCLKLKYYGTLKLDWNKFYLVFVNLVILFIKDFQNECKELSMFGSIYFSYILKNILICEKLKFKQKKKTNFNEVT